MASNGDGSSANGTLSRNYSLNSGSSPRERDYDTLKVQYEKASNDLNNMHRRFEHAMKELEYYRTRHDEYEALRKRYEDLLTSHTQTVAKLELAQAQQQQFDDNALREASLKQQLAKAYSQFDKVVRDCNKFREALQIAQQKYEDAIKEVKQAQTFRIKATKDHQRLTEERNATMTEYNLIMSERDNVHREMEKLSEDLQQAYDKNQLLEVNNKKLLDEKQALNYQMESLRREISSALHDRDKALKECNDLREKFGEYSANKEENRELKSRLDSLNYLGENSARKETQVDARNFSQRQRLDNLDQANQELESLRKSLDKVQSELNEAVQEAEVSKGRRDWAFSERDKIVLERESIRTLCDNMRKERDRAVSELAESLRESDAIKKQRNELVKEVKILKETLEVHMEKEAQLAQFRGIGHTNSHDSAIDSDMQEWETEILEIDLSGLSKDNDLGLELIGGRDNPHFQNDNGIYVAAVTKDSVGEGKLRVNDCITRVNNVDCTSITKRLVLETIRASIPVVHLRVRRKKSWTPRTPPTFQNNAKVARWVHTAKLAAGCHGLSLESGVYISKISEGSLAAKDNSLVVGDRVLRVNNKSMDGYDSIHEALAILNDDRADAITITTLKMSYLDPESTTNVFMPVPRYKKENRSSQTEDEYLRCDFDRRILDYRPKSGQEKNSGAWFREKFDLVRGRRHSKERNRNEDKKKYRNSSPNPLELAAYEQDQESAIAELESVLKTHENSATLKRTKRQKEMSLQEKNGGTWPKARAINILDNTVGTIISKKKERPPLSILINDRDREYHLNRNSTPVALTSNLAPSLPPHLNRHSTYKMDTHSGLSSHSIISPHSALSTHSTHSTHSNRSQLSGHSPHLSVNDSFEKLRGNKLDFERSREIRGVRDMREIRDVRTVRDAHVTNRFNMKSDDSIDFNVEKTKDLIRYRINNKSGIKYDSERDSLISHDHLIPNPSSSNHIHSLLSSPQPRYQPHPHPHPSLLNFPNNHSRESIGFEPSYPHQHAYSSSVDAYPKRPLTSIPIHSHGPYRDPDMVSYSQSLEVGTYPRKRENQRFRIPSNPSVTSAGKVSTGSIERTSERGSPMPIFQVEVLSPGSASKRNSVPDYCWPSQKPLPGELRRVHIDKSNEPLGIQIADSGGIFVSTVNDNSVASRVGLQIGDQLLEVCGINMRNATYNLAASVLRQCGNSITMLVQYSPDKYHAEMHGSGSCSSSSNEDGDGEPTPCNSPKEVRKSHPPLSLPLSVQNTLGRSTGNSSNLQRHSSREEEPRFLNIGTQKTSNLGISLVGGNAVGIFIHSVQPESLAYNAGLRTGDQILEYNGSDLRNATAEEAAYELAKPADKVTVLAHYRIDRYNEIKDKPGDSLFVRCGFDRTGSDVTDNLQLCFNKDDVLYVDNTMFNGVPGHWRAWKLDPEGHRQQCGIIPSKYKVEEELLQRRSIGDLESRGSTLARRSFFKRKKHPRSGSRDSKELASFCNVSSGWYSDNGTLHEDLLLCSYQRVERLDYPEFRPVLVLGPLAECVVDKLVLDLSEKFKKANCELRHTSQAALDQEMVDNLIVDYRRKGNYYECTTVAAIRAICSARFHCMIDISISSVEKLHRQQIYPIVLLIKFKSTKQIKEVKDTRYSLDKLSGKAAKEMYEHCQKLEAEHRHQITTVIPAGANITYITTQVMTAIEAEHNKLQWVAVQ